MERNYSISVAMATYNGEKYIEDQIESILCQLQMNDEIIVSDDGSADNTIEIIKSIDDERIKILSGPKQGVKQNFANAIQNCRGQYIFLSDQDDVWVKNKVECVLKAFKSENCTLVAHDAYITDASLNIIENSYFKLRNSGNGILKNIWKNTYTGCCMAFKRDIIKDILPIPNDIEMHDQWIGLINERIGKSYFLKKPLIKYRRHSNNVSQMVHYPIIKMICNRGVLVCEFLKVKHYWDALCNRIFILMNEVCKRKKIVKVEKKYNLKNIGKKINFVSGSRIYKFKYKKRTYILKGFDIFNLFKNEYRFLSQLEFSYFPKVFTCEKYYFIEEYIEGINLEEFLNSHKESIEEEKVVLKLIEILDILYSKKIIHRDIRPENIIVTKNKDVKLIDFGAALKITDQVDVPNRILFTLGDKYCDMFFWDDAYSINKIIDDFKIDLSIETQKELKSRIGRMRKKKEFNFEKN